MSSVVASLGSTCVSSVLDGLGSTFGQVVYPQCSLVLWQMDELTGGKSGMENQSFLELQA